MATHNSKEYNAKWELEHKEERRKYHAKYRLEHKEERRIASAAHHATHKEEAAKTNAAYRETHHGELIAYWASYRETHKEERAAHRKAHPEQERKLVANRNARKRNAFVESVDHGVVFERDGYVCGICGQPVADETPWLDHVIPLSAGGEHSYANTQCSHPVCNMKKGAKLDYVAS